MYQSNFPSDNGSQKQQRLADREETVFYWQKFEELFPTEEASVDALIASFSEGGEITCLKCYSVETEKVDLRSFKCLSCKKISYFTVGSFFQYLRRIKAMLGAIWLLENGVRFSACHFAELAGVAKSTAHGMVKKIAMLIFRTMDDAADTLVSSQFATIFIRRSLCTPAFEHPRAEQQIAEEKFIESSPKKQRAVHKQLLKSLSKTEALVYEQLSDEPQTRDAIESRLDLSNGEITAALTVLELNGLVVFSGGDMYSRSKSKVFVTNKKPQPPCAPEQKVHASSIVTFIESSKHGIARKYLQLYISLFLCWKDRLKWGLGTIIAAGRRSKPVYLSEIEAFVTPLFVKVGRLSA